MNRRRSLAQLVADHTILVTLAIMFLAPFLFVLLTSLMTAGEAGSRVFWPSSWHPENYVRVFQKLDMLRLYANSATYAGLATLFMLLSSIPAAYALARIKFRGSRLIFVIIIWAMMLPPQITTVPLYVMWSKLGLTGSLWPLILPNLLGDAFSVFLLRQFFLTIPKEYSESAKLDGCGHFQIMTRVVMPMAKPGIAAAAIFLFFWSWNDYYGPLLYTSQNPKAWPISYALATFRTTKNVDWDLTMAAAILAMIPVILIFFAAQKVFVQGITLTGVKG
ncbi:MAG: carbohydrate ABC transporter permease [Propionibacteriaceae bacterium]|nr:carbohydrate ABC transporter permease [Propionibacteriaceae bacterium]